MAQERAWKEKAGIKTLARISPAARQAFEGNRMESVDVEERQNGKRGRHPTPSGQAFERTAHKTGVKQDANIPFSEWFTACSACSCFYSKNRGLPRFLCLIFDEPKRRE